jgi:hypothetical protein
VKKDLSKQYTIRSTVAMIIKRIITRKGQVKNFIQESGRKKIVSMGKIVHPKGFLKSLLKLELKPNEEMIAELTENCISKYSAFYSNVIKGWVEYLYPEKTYPNSIDFDVVRDQLVYTIKCRFCEKETTVSTTRGTYCGDNKGKCRRRFNAAKSNVTDYIKNHSISLAKRVMCELEYVSLESFLMWLYEERT